MATQPPMTKEDLAMAIVPHNYKFVGNNETHATTTKVTPTLLAAFNVAIKTNYPQIKLEPLEYYAVVKEPSPKIRKTDTSSSRQEESTGMPVDVDQARERIRVDIEHPLFDLLSQIDWEDVVFIQGAGEKSILKDEMASATSLVEKFFSDLGSDLRSILQSELTLQQFEDFTKKWKAMDGSHDAIFLQMLRKTVTQFGTDLLQVKVIDKIIGKHEKELSARSIVFVMLAAMKMAQRQQVPKETMNLYREVIDAIKPFIENLHTRLLQATATRSELSWAKFVYYQALGLEDKVSKTEILKECQKRFSLARALTSLPKTCSFLREFCFKDDNASLFEDLATLSLVEGYQRQEGVTDVRVGTAIISFISQLGSKRADWKDMEKFINLCSLVYFKNLRPTDTGPRKRKPVEEQQQQQQQQQPSIKKEKTKVPNKLPKVSPTKSTMDREDDGSVSDEYDPDELATEIDSMLSISRKYGTDDHTVAESKDVSPEAEKWLEDLLLESYRILTGDYTASKAPPEVAKVSSPIEEDEDTDDITDPSIASY